MTRKIRFIVVHHAANPRATFETITRSHRARGFRGIGYHVVVQSGVRRGGRPEAQPGAHTQRLNGTSLAVCIADNCNLRLRPEDWEAVVATCADWCARYGLPASAVIGHRETPMHGGAPTRKLCPGKLVDIDALRAAVAARLART